MPEQEINYTYSNAETKYSCGECDKHIDFCDSCSEAIEDTVICFNGGVDHLCCDECMKIFAKETYPGHSLEEM